MYDLRRKSIVIHKTQTPPNNNNNDNKNIVSLPSVEAIWEAFNDLADGFGVSLYEFKEICAELADELGMNRAKIDEKSNSLFGILDDDKVKRDEMFLTSLQSYYVLFNLLLFANNLFSALSSISPHTYTEWSCGWYRVYFYNCHCFRDENETSSRM